MKAFERFFTVLKKAHKSDINNWHDFNLLYIEIKYPLGTSLDSKEILIPNCAHKHSETAYIVYTATSEQGHTAPSYGGG